MHMQQTRTADMSDSVRTTPVERRVVVTHAQRPRTMMPHATHIDATQSSTLARADTGGDACTHAPRYSRVVQE